MNKNLFTRAKTIKQHFDCRPYDLLIIGEVEDGVTIKVYYDLLECLKSEIVNQGIREVLYGRDFTITAVQDATGNEVVQTVKKCDIEHEYKLLRIYKCLEKQTFDLSYEAE